MADKITAGDKENSAGQHFSASERCRFRSDAHVGTRAPKERRRVILMIGEKRDLGSEIRGREALIEHATIERNALFAPTCRY